MTIYRDNGYELRQHPGNRIEVYNGEHLILEAYPKAPITKERELKKYIEQAKKLERFENDKRGVGECQSD